jgi:hypothetical protein
LWRIENNGWKTWPDPYNILTDNERDAKLVDKNGYRNK